MMIYIFCGIFLFLGVGIGFRLGYRHSHNVYGKLVDDGLVVFKVAEGGWDGMPEAFRSLREWLDHVG